MIHGHCQNSGKVAASFLSCLSSAIFSQMAVDCSPIKVLADNPVGQTPEFALVVVQVVTMVKQKLRKLRQDLPQGVLILQLHKCPGAAAVLDWPASFPRYAEGVAFRRVKRENLLQTNL